MAETNGVKNKHEKDVIDARFGVAWAEIKNNDNGKLDGMLNLRLKKTATNPVTKEQTNYLLPLRIRLIRETIYALRVVTVLAQKMSAILAQGS